ncbi:tRNA (guanosine(46)-N7)-methyltransferase TrmB [Leptolyngbya sp. 7M]|uniref:tRNA (guanosine(46)-N7)-methyltransferase TrmB n=1 Tax=Leptolyngbya sp. 7M TaxID=2812896 RepID=UPI001B8B1B39|nr:tRNA (guanosine(46)-N7)-methyltransferase TrmB [Leptolyngbya sp. 7M]QYO67275.1 tRNA (guanosine(46)-N7)-methyltransferase TrmB [Leptolyngbya sp. 7M]
MPRVRVHQHVNPLAPYFRQAPKPIDIDAVFAEPRKPLLLDIGCARGRFLLRMAELEPEWNYLGVEIREPLVKEADRLASAAGLTNLHYVFCNAMLWMDRLLENIPAKTLQAVTIQFPDPWFKKKHAKRRMVNKEMVDAIAKHLAPQGKVFIQTDIEFLAEEMFALFRGDSRFSESSITINPFPVKTEREKAVEDKNMPIFRGMFSMQEDPLG